MGQGQGPGLTDRVLGEQSGQENVTLITSQIPSHTHSLKAVSDAGDNSAPEGAYLANTGALDKEYKTSGDLVPMNANAIGANGGSQPHDNLPPYIVLTFYIAMEGIFPSRN